MQENLGTPSIFMPKGVEDKQHKTRSYIVGFIPKDLTLMYRSPILKI